MALYLGNEKVKIYLNGVAYCLRTSFEAPAINGVRLLTSDNYILKDANRLFVTAKEVK